MYALGKEAKVTGAFKAFRFVNPHSTMKLDVKGEDGKVVEWTFVGGSVNAISRLGLKEGPNALKPGDEITVIVSIPFSAVTWVPTTGYTGFFAKVSVSGQFTLRRE